MKLLIHGLDWALTAQGKTLLRADAQFPLLFTGCGRETVEMYRGNFRIEDYVIERVPRAVTALEPTEGGARISFGETLRLELVLGDDWAELRFRSEDPSINRFWLRLPAEPEERCWGCGEQMSYFNLRGRHFPLWSSEPGVGRDKNSYVTWRSDVENRAGGDYYNTNFPQTTFVSSRHYYLHADTTAYADFDFRSPDFHELQIWKSPV